MSPDTVTPTPGVERVIRFQLGTSDFGFRRPSRADVSDAWRGLTRKLAASGAPDTLNYFAGEDLQWEARLEIGLLPRVRGGQVLDLGERAPSHWLLPLLAADGVTVIGQVVDFANVDPDEFRAVCAHLDAELKKKAPSPAPISTSSAPGPING